MAVCEYEHPVVRAVGLSYLTSGSYYDFGSSQIRLGNAGPSGLWTWPSGFVLSHPILQPDLCYSPGILVSASWR